ncbi:transmembrane protein 267-like isoform X2 [Corticium candelabrum]|uniref:transmembrane protein 267-like isoform X2 n=1 Tax=Corticium candelabrum TaxID=121492 RepID=UPI002E275C6E|nr:transmembrane protein 267-like isoform X2 [Corticium candelabrum]
MATSGVLLKTTLLMDFWQICCCGIMACALDIDHFVQARSFSLEDATSLQHRSFAHSMWFIILGTAACCCVKMLICQKLLLLSFLPWLFFVATASHHLRDATRRGLWFWPIGNTPPLPLLIYLQMVLLIPLIVRFLLQLSRFSHKGVSLSDVLLT